MLLSGVIIAYPLPYLSLNVCIYVPYGFVPPVLVIRVRSFMYDRIYRGIVCGHDSVHALTFSRSICARSSIHARIISRNVHARFSAIIHAYVSVIILDHTPACLCVHAWAPASICAHDPTSIRVHSGCSACMSVVMSNNLKWSQKLL